MRYCGRDNDTSRLIACLLPKKVGKHTEAVITTAAT
jgi:hypothetical protein